KKIINYKKIKKKKNKKFTKKKKKKKNKNSQKILRVIKKKIKNKFKNKLTILWISHNYKKWNHKICSTKLYFTLFTKRLQKTIKCMIILHIKYIINHNTKFIYQHTYKQKQNSDCSNINNNQQKPQKIRIKQNKNARTK